MLLLLLQLMQLLLLQFPLPLRICGCCCWCCCDASAACSCCCSCSLLLQLIQLTAQALRGQIAHPVFGLLRATGLGAQGQSLCHSLTAMDYDAAALKFCIASDYVDAQAAFEVAVAADRKAKSDCKRHNDRESREGSRNRPAAESPTYIAPGSWYYAERDEDHIWIEEDANDPLEAGEAGSEPPAGQPGPTGLGGHLEFAGGPAGKGQVAEMMAAAGSGHEDPQQPAGPAETRGPRQQGSKTNTWTCRGSFSCGYEKNSFLDSECVACNRPWYRIQGEDERVQEKFQKASLLRATDLGARGVAVSASRQLAPGVPTSSSGDTIPPWGRSKAASRGEGADNMGCQEMKGKGLVTRGPRQAHWSEICKEGKGSGSKGSHLPASGIVQAARPDAEEQPPVEPRAPSLDQLLHAMEAAAEALGPQHLVTEVVRAEYEAAVHMRLCQGMPVVKQLADARLRGQATFRALVQLQSKMTGTAARLEQTLMTRSRQITEEMELQEKLRWASSMLVLAGTTGMSSCLPTSGRAWDGKGGH